MTPDLPPDPVQFESVFEEEIKRIKTSRDGRNVKADDLHLKDSLVGLAFSGGGIRSATFNLGILQAFAKRHILHQFDYLSTVSGGGYIGGWLAALTKRLIGTPPHKKFSDVEEALIPEQYTPDQRGKHSFQRDERSFLHWLRLYSNYLTPHKGLLSGDTWAMFSTWMRNTALNQAILFLFCASLFLLCQSLLVVLLHPGGGSALLWWCVVAVFLAGLFMGINVMKRDPERPFLPSWLEMPATIVLPLVASLLLNALLWQQRTQKESFGDWTIWMTWGLAGGAYYLVPGILVLLFEPMTAHPRPHDQKPAAQAPEFQSSMRSVLSYWFVLLFCSFVAGVVGGCAAKAYGSLLHYLHDLPPRNGVHIPAAQWIVAVVGTGVIMGIMILTGILRQGLTGKSVDDLVRERWARVGGYLTLTTIGWILFAGACAFGPLLFRWSMAKWIAGASGALVWIVGTLTGLNAAKSAKVSGEELKNLASAVLQAERKKGIRDKLRSPRVFNAVANTAPYIFVVGLLLLLATAAHIGAGLVYHPSDTTDLWLHQLSKPTPSYETYWRIVDSPSETAPPQAQAAPALRLAVSTPTQAQVVSNQAQAVSIQAQARWLALFGFIFLVATCLLSWRVDINEFSMHHFYRNRLVRCYLGASNPERKPQPFTGFAPEDDPLLEEFAMDYPGPYPILNASLNITGGKELGYGTRRAKSFVFTPLYCGYEKNKPGKQEFWFEPTNPAGTFCETFAPTSLGRTKGLCGRSRQAKKISLGTAMAISGAALSPNMGYHTSPATALLMTLFDARLGWWMGNPRKLGKKLKRWKWTSPGPRLGLGYLFSELLGQANEDKCYVYLSDGGHFENLGVYELIRRKCKLIVACDAGCDEKYHFDDLRALIEKARMDFGARIVIDFDRIRPKDREKTTAHNFAVGTIHYNPQHPKDPAEQGTFIYIKASLPEHGAHQNRTEESLPDDIWRYVENNPDFPHESTADQWFDEWQFESYRALGEHIGDAVAGLIGHCVAEVLALEPTVQAA